MKGIYLAKRGEVLGPFSQTEFEKLKTTGRIWDYSWIWDDAKHVWAPVDLPPPPIESASVPVTEASSSEGAMVVVPAAPKSPSPEVPRATAKAPKEPTRKPLLPSAFSLQELPKLSVICFTHQSADQGKIIDATSIGCTFVSRGGRESPRFGGQSKVHLSFLDAKSGKLDSVDALIVGRSYSQEGWVYQIRWKTKESVRNLDHG